MMTLKWIDLHCPVCESVFESMAASSNDEAGQDYYIEPGMPGGGALLRPSRRAVVRARGEVVMIARPAMPNVLRRARPSWNLAISRHGATRTVTSVHGAYGVNVRLRWLTSTYPLTTETTRVALALLFPLV